MDSPREYSDHCLLRQTRLFGFQVSEGNGTAVADVPEAADLGRVGASREIHIGDVDAIN